MDTSLKVSNPQIFHKLNESTKVAAIADKIQRILLRNRPSRLSYSVNRRLDSVSP